MILDRLEHPKRPEAMRDNEELAPRTLDVLQVDELDLFADHKKYQAQSLVVRMLSWVYLAKGKAVDYEAGQTLLTVLPHLGEPIVL